MVQDTIVTDVMDKQLQPSDKVVESLVALRDELYARKDPALREAFFKINSCLYGEYPTHK